jgi:hypothetical protein
MCTEGTLLAFSNVICTAAHERVLSRSVVGHRTFNAIAGVGFLVFLRIHRDWDYPDALTNKTRHYRLNIDRCAVSHHDCPPAFSPDKPPDSGLPRIGTKSVKHFIERVSKCLYCRVHESVGRFNGHPVPTAV